MNLLTCSVLNSYKEIYLNEYIVDTVYIEPKQQQKQQPNTYKKMYFYDKTMSKTSLPCRRIVSF